MGVIVALFLIALYFAANFATAYFFLSPLRTHPKRPSNLEEFWLGEIPTWVSKDFLEGSPDTLFLLIHGYGGSRGTWKPLAARLVEEGYAVMIPAMPGRDANPAPRVTFGPGEIAALLACAREAVRRHPQIKIVLGGISLGGAACWLAAEDCPNLVALFTEGAFADLSEAIDDNFRSIGFWAPWFLAPARSLAMRWSSTDPKTIRPLEAATRLKGRLPMLVIHGDHDRLFPLTHAKRLAEASGARLWIAPGGRHASIQRSHTTRMTDAILATLGPAIKAEPDNSVVD